MAELRVNLTDVIGTLSTVSSIQMDVTVYAHSPSQNLKIREAIQAVADKMKGQFPDVDSDS